MASGLRGPELSSDVVIHSHPRAEVTHVSEMEVAGQRRSELSVNEVPVQPAIISRCTGEKSLPAEIESCFGNLNG